MSQAPGNAALLVSEAGTQAKRTSDLQARTGARGLLLRVAISNLIADTAGPPEYTPAIVRVGPDGSEDTVWAASAALTADGTYLYLIAAEGSQGGTLFQEVENLPLPPEWKLELRVAKTDAANNATTEADGSLLD